MFRRKNDTPEFVYLDDLATRIHPFGTPTDSGLVTPGVSVDGWEPRQDGIYLYECGNQNVVGTRYVIARFMRKTPGLELSIDAISYRANSRLGVLGISGYEDPYTYYEGGLVGFKNQNTDEKRARHRRTARVGDSITFKNNSGRGKLPALGSMIFNLVT